MRLRSFDLLSARVSVAYRRVVAGGHVTLRIIRAENLLFMSAAIAYYAFISLLPFLVLLVTAISIIGGESLAMRLLGVTGSVLAPRSQSLITTVIKEMIQDIHLSGITGLIFVWGTLRIFWGIDTAFAAIYGKQHAKSIRIRLRDALIVMLAISVALTGAALLGLGSLLPPHSPLRFQAELFIGLFFVFLPVYYLFPDTKSTVRQVIPGTVVAALGWSLLDILFQFYLTVRPQTTTYGVVGAVLIVLVWLYLGGFSLLFGAVLNAVLTDHRLVEQSSEATEV